METNNRWRDRSACLEVDPESFFPSASDTESIHEAKKICIDSCPVQWDCLAYALDHHEDGIWGGTTERERRRIRRNLAMRNA